MARRCDWELSWERGIPSGVDAPLSHPSRPASPQTAWQGQPELEEPSEREIRRYQTSDLKRGKSGDFLRVCYKLTPSSGYADARGGREGGVRARGGCVLRLSNASLFFLKATKELSLTWWMLGQRAGSDKAQLSAELQKGFFPAPLPPPRRACTPPVPPSSALDDAGIRRLPPWEGPSMAGATSWGCCRAVWLREVKNEENPRAEPGTDVELKQLRLLWSPSSFVRV